MIEAVKSGKIQCVVVKDLSRFGRDYLETGYYIETIFPLLNVRFIAIVLPMPGIVRQCAKCSNKKFQQNFLKIVVMNQIRVLIEAACDKKKVLQTIQQKMAKPGSVNHVQRNIIRLSEREQELDDRILRAYVDYADKLLDAEEYQNKVKEFGPGFEKYFTLHYDEKTQAFVLTEERCSVVERELDLAGYFCIITSEKMSAKEAIELYKSRDTSEKLFRGDKSYLGNKSIRVYSEESARAKIFVEFVAMILRCKMYIKLKEEMKNLEKKPNYMTVPAALKELEKIEMVRQLDNVYRLDHAVTANQKTILNAFGLDANHIKNYASELSKELKKAE